MDVVTAEQAQKIVSTKINTMGLLSDGSPKSAAIGIALADNDSFTKRKAVPISTLVAEKVFDRHIQDLWNDMVWYELPLVFESYLRMVLTEKRHKITVDHLTANLRTFDSTKHDWWLQWHPDCAGGQEHCEGRH